MQRALSLNAGMALQVKYIAVGSGLQALQFDDGGRAMTDILANLVGYVAVAAANKVSPYQWQMTVNLAGLSADEWRLSEFALCDADHNVIAIYGSATQAIYPVTPYVTDALLSVNLLLAAFPANSITIEHHNAPLSLFQDDLEAAIYSLQHDALKKGLSDIQRDERVVALDTRIAAVERQLAIQQEIV